MSKKIRVAILFGGKSAEHEVSLRSAESVANAIDKSKYEVVLIGIDKTGRWLMGNSGVQLLNTSNPKLYKLNSFNTSSVTLVPQGGGNLSVPGQSEGSQNSIDVVFPILHGPFGEDGTVQGLLKLANIPFVGASVLGSAVGMDKDIMKRLLRQAGIPIGKFITIRSGQEISFAKAKKDLGLPLFIKPANMGSSVGVSKVENKEQFETALAEAFRFDNKIIFEEFIDGREIECSVLGNDSPIASLPGEIIVKKGFYDYETKYIDESAAHIEIPAKLPKKIIKDIQTLAIKTFKVLSCEGLGRVDCFLTKKGKVIINEINTMPGFTNMSVYPKLWEASGICYSELIDRLIELALERFEKEKKLEVSYV
ncbi:MAG: D-alanine--D-alanine ligase [Candidatus Paceibacterota bacterium]